MQVEHAAESFVHDLRSSGLLDQVHHKPARIQNTVELLLGGTRPISFDPLTAIEYRRQERLPEHANGMRFFAYNSVGAELLHLTAYSIGGGFVLRAGEEESSEQRPTPFDVSTGECLLAACMTETESPRRIADVARANERTSRSDQEIDGGLLRIWDVMKGAVTRPAPQLASRLMGTTKAITAARIALESNSALAKVSLNDVVRTMWATAQDMNTRYKETSLGRLAVNVSVRISE